jgi:hypothetical protein
MKFHSVFLTDQSQFTNKRTDLRCHEDDCSFLKKSPVIEVNFVLARSEVKCASTARSMKFHQRLLNL